MSIKYERISEIYADTCKAVVSSPKRWQEFLKSACRNYKLRFDELLLIYAQRPDATAVLEIEQWNKFGRYVKRGSHGIAVFENAKRTNQRLVHYFDISDTANSKYARPVPIWKMKEEYENKVINGFEKRFGVIENNSTLPDAIVSTVSKTVEASIQNYKRTLIRELENSFLSDLDETAITSVYRNIVSNSVAFLVMTRLDIDTSKYFDDEDFSDITSFNTVETLNAIGLATGEVYQKLLTSVANVVLSLEKNRKAIDEKNNNNYNENSSKNIDERSFSDERNQIQDGRRLHASGLWRGREGSGDGAGAGNIRTAEERVPDGVPQAGVHEPLNNRQADGTSFGRGEAGSGADRHADGTDEGKTGLDRGAESQRPDGMGSGNEQHPERSERDSERTGDLRLKPLPSLENQISAIEETEETKTSVFSFSQEIIDNVLCSGSGVSEGKLRIYEQYRKNLSSKENEKFLKDEYGTGGSMPVITVNENNINEWHDGKGIELSTGFNENAVKLHLPWKKVEHRISDLIKLDRYLNPKEKEYYPKWLEEKESKELDKSSLKADSPEKKEYEYHLGNKVYIGASEYEILSFDENRVMLYDTGSPLFNQEMTRSDFDRLVSENPMNDHLKVNKLPPEEIKTDVSYTDAFFVNADNESVVWMYYNPDSTAGGQYVTNTLTFDEIIQAADNNQSPEGFFDYLGSIAKQELADIGTEWFEDAEKDFSEKPDYTDCTSQTMSALTQTARQALELPVYDRETEILYNILTSLQIDDVTLSYDENGLVAKVGDKEWHGAEFYQFLTGEKSIQSIDVELLTDFKALCEHNEVEFKTGGSERVVQTWEQKKKERVKNLDLYPEIPMSARHTFNLKENEVEYVGKKERFRRNIMAIQLLKKCQDENRFATPEEQVILSKYVGWGGIPEAFDERNSAWATEYLELLTVLTPDEYVSARESTLTAFYTPPEVITAIYSSIENMGFKQGNILEPSCGIGNFIGMLPDSMKESKVYGVELDTISGSIAQQLYQKHSIAVQGFEETNLPDSFFDIAVGNVPFGDFKVIDKRYDKHKFLIHDYFFAKTLDKLRPGGVMAFITSKGTMDKENNSVRKYIAQRAELLGAIRLPNDTFKGNAGTEVVSDILFLQKRDRELDLSPDWVDLAVNDDGIKMNSYFVQHPEMILGEMKMISGRFGTEATCEPIEGADLKSQLAEAVSKINGTISAYEQNEIEEATEFITAEPTVRNFSYTVVDGNLYYRENSRMNLCKVSSNAETRIKEMIKIRDSARNLLDLQKENFPDDDIKAEQENLNKLYDKFIEKYGLLSSRGNSVFKNDSSYPLLTSLEIVNEEGQLERKADMFTKRTIRPHQAVTSVDTASEALALSIGEKVTVDMEYMSELTGKSEQEIFKELKGVIFLNPMHGYGTLTEAKYLTADEYLSGNVREKLRTARKTAELYPDDFQVNVEALEKVQPKDLTASEISVRLGATWLPSEIVQQFVFELLQTPIYSQRNISVNFSQFTGKWSVTGKSSDKYNIKACKTFGTSRINAYQIIEETLNLKDVRINDTVSDEIGKKKSVLNKKETAIAQSKQEAIKQAFQEWIWKNPIRREELTKMYNEKFNSIRPREYDGSHIVFSGMNPEIKLREHQRNAVAHILYGGNTLLAHVVGAGKTFEMVAAAQESKRLGLCQKSLFVVPNHLTEQWASEYLQLYPAANILVATKKDFETKNRKRFCGRIATGDYDAVIIGHSQFEKIPMSIERQRAFLEEQLDDITNGIDEIKRNRGDSFSVKELERTRKAVKQKLDKLNDQSRKDDVVTFEELGVDRIFIDESHYYKNLFLYTKMRNVGGIAQTEAQKSSDLFMKCRYLDELTGGRGVVFATGTPISNSMVELYTIQRYLQYGKLQQNGLQHFDAWASTFGETVTATELTPEGTGYRMKTRFSRFYNLPELMAMFKEAADIKTADMLNLPVPKANFHNVAVKPSEMQKEMVLSLSERAEKVRNGMVDSKDDNMLKITNDGRKLALDQRMINPMLPDFEGSKLNACVDNIHRIWTETADKKSTQLVFCDLSTPKKDGSFNTYDDIRNKLIKRGVPKEEIRFIHEADTEAKKQELFKKVRKGEVRILIGSTQKMGAGTNVQDKLIALHDLDCPWRPADLEQRSGRIIRQGNENPEVDIYRYVTEQTFDAYLYQLVEGKQKFASQIMTSKSPVRSAEDIDETALSYAEIKMLATGNPYIKEKMDLDIQVQKLKVLKSSFSSERYALEDKILKYFPFRISAYETRIKGLQKDIDVVSKNPRPDENTFTFKIDNKTYTKRTKAGMGIIEACKAMTSPDPVPLGEYRGFKLELAFDRMERMYEVKIKGNISLKTYLSDDPSGNTVRIDNVIDKYPEALELAQRELEETRKQFEAAKEEVEKPFSREEELKAKTERLNELNKLLSLEDKPITAQEAQENQNQNRPKRRL